MKYITTYFMSFIILLFSIATFNWFIDPFGMYWSPVIESVNTVKPEAATRSRITKAYQAEKVNPQILIVGNSRVEMGLNPVSEAFSGKTVYNQGMPGASVEMQIDYVIDTIANNNGIERILIGVDFVDFLLNKQQVQSDSNKSLPGYAFRLSSLDQYNESAKFERLKEKISLVFSLDAFSASVSTLLQQKSTVSSIVSNGFNTASSYIGIMNTEGIKPLFKQKITELSSKLKRKSALLTSSDKAPYSPIFAQLGRLIDSANKQKIKVDFFINPYHISYLHTLSANNQWHNFELWKKTLVDYLAEKQGEQFSLWDFSGFNTIINEPVPLASPKKQMQWFWEPAHYKKELGELILFTLLKHDKVNPHTVNAFGVQLSSENIAEQTRLSRKQLKATLPSWLHLKKELNL
jgi:hypothetical protein